VLQGSARRLTSVQAEGVAIEEPSVGAVTMNERALTSVLAGAPPSTLRPSVTLSASNPMRPSSITIVDESPSGDTSMSGSSSVRLNDRRLQTSSPTITFDFSSAPTPGWSTGVGGNYPFVRRSGRTSSAETGPFAGVGGSGFYYYAEASWRDVGDLFTLSYDGSFCASSGLVVATVDFRFHMYGATMGTLSIVSTAGWVAWSLSGDQGNTWLSASVDLFSTSFSFEYVRGSDFEGDAAVGQVAVSCGTAPPPSPPSPPSPPTAPPPPASPPFQPPAPRVVASQSSDDPNLLSAAPALTVSLILCTLVVLAFCVYQRVCKRTQPANTAPSPTAAHLDTSSTTATATDPPPSLNTPSCARDGGSSASRFVVGQPVVAVGRPVVGHSVTAAAVPIGTRVGRGCSDGLEMQMASAAPAGGARRSGAPFSTNALDRALGRVLDR
jgi:hypothetical protein